MARRTWSAAADPLGMPDLSLTAFDVAAFLVVGLSVLVAYLRGAIRELLTIATWLGAGVVAFYGFPYARELARRTMETEWLADAIALCVVFVVPLIGFKVAAAVLTDHIPGGHVATVDRVAGAVFGLARGALLVCLAYLGLTVLVAREDHPDWIKNAILLPYVEDGAALLNRLMPENVAARGLGAATLMPRQGHALRALIRIARIPVRS
jgi:membrane protein required for colicin V production